MSFSLLNGLQYQFLILEQATLGGGYSYAYQAASANWDRPTVSTTASLGGLGRGGSEEELRGDF